MMPVVSVAWINAASEIRIQRSAREGALLDAEEGTLLTTNGWNSHIVGATDGTSFPLTWMEWPLETLRPTCFTR